jgi:hypothetical protein
VGHVVITGVDGEALDPAEPVGVLRPDHEMGDRLSDGSTTTRRTCPRAPSLQLTSAPITKRAISAMDIFFRSFKP